MKNKLDYALYLVTDRGILGDRDLETAVEQSILGGATIVQLREKDISSLDFYNIAKSLKKVTDKYNVPLLINDRLDIALAVDAAGAHIGQEDLPCAVARKMLGPDKILGITANTVEAALKAQEEGADYLGVGAVYPTGSKEIDKPIGVEQLGVVKKAVNIPVVAIGGINENNISELKPTGIEGVSVISAILGKEDIKKASEELLSIFKDN
ncbi:thiamine-phosphate diphosphorylase [Desulfonispora thiosulfatigenes DSM 11270]|uniref:Thiamine-phosphate synthase n=1 Tax=Desulfonispora thiosulfatigenes DSM 11270 TaxID=656914 RepID=A0A1W1V411_DESTI|nr:thiamine phosphate synthase [Desulfonispora thiosulfatigenes]SMB87993.1 thiamine-phosphate diphosphorylase [Desulfonispora thiosulfatigenes DSM 11270]